MVVSAQTQQTPSDQLEGTYIVDSERCIAVRPSSGWPDQYALAATAYHLLTGETLFPNTNPAVVISCHLTTDPPPLSQLRPTLMALDPVLAAAPSKNPDDRFSRCADFARAFAEQASTPAIPSDAPTTPAPTKQPSSPSDDGA